MRQLKPTIAHPPCTRRLWPVGLFQPISGFQQVQQSAFWAGNFFRLEKNVLGCAAYREDQCAAITHSLMMGNKSKICDVEIGR
jgi:hypothetical protein